MKTPRVNIGQSEFQDTFLVIGDEATPYRKLRKLELQIRELEDAIKMNEFSVRKTSVKIERIGNTKDELEQIEKEELEYSLSNVEQLIDDAQRRLANFNEIKRQLLENTPDAYWEQGFENAEIEYWIDFFSRKGALEIMCNGRLSAHILGEIAKLPEDLTTQIMRQIPHKHSQLGLLTAVAEDEIKKLFSEDEDQKQLKSAELHEE